MRNREKSFCVVGLIVFIHSFLFPMDSPEFSGYVESRYFLLFNREYDTFQSLWSRAVIDLKAGVNENAKVFIRLRGENFSGYPVSVAFADEALSGVTVRSVDFDRFFIDINADRLRLKLGRQVVSWSFCYLFRPLDIFMPISIYEPGFEFPGVNSIRTIYNTGQLSQLDVVFVPSVNYENSTLAVGFVTNVLSSDVLMDWSHHRVGDFVGLAVKKDLGVGVWIESKYYYRSEVERYGKKFNTVIGFDYTLLRRDRLYFCVEYSHDQTGFPKGKYDYGAVYKESRTFLGRNYLFVTLSLPAARRVSFSANFIKNMDDGASLLCPNFTVNYRVNVSLSAGCYLNLSEWETEFSPGGEAINAMYVFIRAHF